MIMCNLKSVVFSTLLLTVSLCMQAQENNLPKRWSIYSGFGQESFVYREAFESNKFYDFDMGNVFFVNADYYIKRKLVVSGGLYFEQDGIATYYSDGIGLKKVNRMGFNAGVKYYLLAEKWIIQPYGRVSLQTNFLNLGTTKASERFIVENGYPDSHVKIDYDIQCPALSVIPKVGFEVRLFSSVSFYTESGCRIGVGGHSRYDVDFISGPLMGQSYRHENTNISTGFNIGLKIDFPLRKVSGPSKNTLFTLLYSFISSKK